MLELTKVNTYDWCVGVVSEVLADCNTRHLCHANI